jgi:hypothetical protein
MIFLSQPNKLHLLLLVMIASISASGLDAAAAEWQSVP